MQEADPIQTKAKENPRRPGRILRTVGPLAVRAAAIAGTLGLTSCAPRALNNHDPDTSVPPASPTASFEPGPTSTQVIETPAPILETPSRLTGENFARFTTAVSNEEFQRLLQEQPDKFPFPAIPGSSDFEMGNLERAPLAENTKGNVKTIEMTGSNYLIVSPIDGEIVINRDPRSQKVGSIDIRKKISDNTTLWARVGIMATATIISPFLDNGQVAAGMALANVSGPSRWSFISGEKLPAPITVKDSTGTFTFSSMQTYITPPINGTGWVSKDGRIVIPMGIGK